MDDSFYHHHPPPPGAGHHYPYYPPPPPSSAPPQPQPPPPPHPYSDHHYAPPHPYLDHHYAPPPPSHHYPPPTHVPPPHYPPHVPPPAPHYSLPHPELAGKDEVRTLFIAGLPDDVKHREIYHLFREFPGYESCQLRTSGPGAKAYGFAVFTNQHAAVSAMHALNGIVFDLEKGTALHINLAKSNSKSKRSRIDDEAPYISDKKVRDSLPYSRGFPDPGVGSNIHMPGMGNSGYSTNAYPSTQSHTTYEALNVMDPHNLDSSAPQNNTPCPTLFVARLGPSCTEQELTQVFSRCPGFLKLKMQNKNGVPVAFVDFQDTVSSTGALNHLQGTILYSSLGEGMRLEYAKARMGLRRRDSKT